MLFRSGRKEFQAAIDAMHYDLNDNKIFAAMAVHKMGVPKDMPTGIDKTGYVKLTAAAKAASPKWAEEDIFVV